VHNECVCNERLGRKGQHQVDNFFFNITVSKFASVPLLVIFVTIIIILLSQNLIFVR